MSKSSADVAGSKWRQLLAVTPAEDQADIRSAAGSGAGAFLLPPELPSQTMNDDYYYAAGKLSIHISP